MMNDIIVVGLMNGSRKSHGFGEDSNRVISPGGGWHMRSEQGTTKNQSEWRYMCREYKPFRERYERQLLLLGRDKSNSDM